MERIFDQDLVTANRLRARRRLEASAAKRGFAPAERTWTLDREPPFIAEGLRSGTLTQEEVDEWRSLCPSS